MNPPESWDGIGDFQSSHLQYYFSINLVRGFVSDLVEDLDLLS